MNIAIKGVEMTEEEISDFRTNIEKYMNKYRDNASAHMIWADLDDAIGNLLDFITRSEE